MRWKASRKGGLFYKLNAGAQGRGEKSGVHLVPKLLLGNAQHLVKLQLQPFRQSLQFSKLELWNEIKILKALRFSLRLCAPASPR